MPKGFWEDDCETGERDGEGVSVLYPVLPLLTGDPLRASCR